MDRAEIVSISETLKVPAGAFDRVLKTRETTPLEPDNREFKYYAPGVGLLMDGDLVLVRHGSRDAVLKAGNKDSGLPAEEKKTGSRKSEENEAENK